MLRPNRRLGQNFLVDRNIVEKIVNSIDAPDNARIIEIGAGTGALTGKLLQRFNNVVAVEIDERAVGMLRAEFPGIDIRHSDILATDWDELTCGAPSYIVGNLPYYITSPILFKMIDSDAPIMQATIMVQFEVAKRLVAKPRTKDYGILSVTAQLAGDVRLLFKVSKHVFRPVPDVESAIVQIDFQKSVSRSDPFVRRVIRTSFNQRRKTLRNSLRSITSETGVSLSDEFRGRRPEELQPEQFVELANFLKGGQRPIFGNPD